MRRKQFLGVAVLAASCVALPSSAFAQEAAEPPRSAAQQLIHDAANGRPSRRPESMTNDNWNREAFVPTRLASEEANVVSADAAVGGASEDAALESRVTALRPGRFLWMPERQANGAVVIVVSLAEQMAYVFRGGDLIGASTVSTGMASHPTPTGSFTILQKHRTHFSSLYDNAPMPNMQRLTWDGIALHAGANPGHPASHGCIRLPMAFSNHLFAATQMGGRVHIIGESPPSAAGALAYVQSVAGETASR